MTAGPPDPFAAPDGPPAGASPYGGPPHGAPSYGGQPYGGQPYGGQPYGGQPYGAPAYGSPAGPPGMPELASWGLRVGGYLIDALIGFAVGLVLGVVGLAIGQSLDALSNVVGLALFLYFGYLTGTTGQTPGRKVVGIRVLREQDGQVLGAGAGIGRAFLHILDALPLGLGFLWPIWDAKKQTFADKVIKSVVVKV